MAYTVITFDRNSFDSHVVDVELGDSPLAQAVEESKWEGCALAVAVSTGGQTDHVEGEFLSHGLHADRLAALLQRARVIHWELTGDKADMHR